ncbi:MAG: FtsW/RodA/SpoVE family cell cycle protein [Lachnospiraceae bacterium]|nr:FtsW/RodA/SpoVE family cell cycle protein [Lachnospiraceae bacterium]
MTNVLTEISKYLMLLIMIIYTFFNFIAIGVKTEKRLKSLCSKQLFMIILMLVLGYLIIVLRKEDYTIIAFFAVQLVFYLLYYILFPRFYKKCSRLIVSNTIMLFGFGVMYLTRLDYARAITQFSIGSAAFAISMLVPVIIKKLSALAKWAWLYAILGLGLLGVVWRLGSTTYGAQLTLSLGPVTIQPSELVKISFVFFTASMFNRSRTFKQIVITTAVAAAHVLILVASTDLGSGLVYFVSYLFMIFVATHKARYFAAGIGAGAVAAVGAYAVFDHVRIRVKMWLNPFSDYENKGYQMAQSLFAISSGGWFGLGLCKGYPTSIPLARNDFIFSAIIEELGIIFAACLLLIYLGFLIQLFRVSTRIDGIFYQIIGVGLAAMIGIQVFLHVGGVTGMIPSTGITLPLISYGGSSVLSTMLTIGVIQGLNIKSDGMTAKQRAEFENRELSEESPEEISFEE